MSSVGATSSAPKVALSCRDKMTETIKIKHPSIKGEYVVINKDAYDPSMHEVFEKPKPKPKRRSRKKKAE